MSDNTEVKSPFEIIVNACSAAGVPLNANQALLVQAACDTSVEALGIAAMQAATVGIETAIKAERQGCLAIAAKLAGEPDIPADYWRGIDAYRNAILDRDKR